MRDCANTSWWPSRAQTIQAPLLEVHTGRYLGECARVMRPGGKLIASIHDKPAGGVFSGDEHRADFAAEHFTALAMAAGWSSLAAPYGVCGQSVMAFERVRR